jgi:alcohol dehydrogenase
VLASAFSLSRLPCIEFGAGRFSKISVCLDQFGKRILIVTGARSFVASPHWPQLTQALKALGISWELCQVKTEPSPGWVDETVRDFRTAQIGAVLGIGGGSALDAAKAVAGLLRVNHSVMDYLEGVGPERVYAGPAVPLVAVPTTAGTGSEATKNAVLSIPGPQGFKKSFRHEMLVPRYAIVDPDLLADCPRDIIAANGMDALTQLLESYVSIKSNPVTDALALSGLRAARDSLLAWHGDKDNDAARAGMAYAALLSGITLAQAGLGSVHGLASPLGAFFPIPHGVVCGTLVAAATQVNIEAMLEREPQNPALEKYTRVTELLDGRRYRNREAGWKALIRILKQWTRKLHLPPLSRYGVKQDDVQRIIAHCRGSSMKTNPIVLTDAEVGEILLQRL